MEGEIRVKIDGNEVNVEKGSTVLDAARAAGVYVPTLCNHPDLPPYGACRMCICEIEGMKGYPTACTVPATDGMKVSTDTDKVKELRREVLSLLLEKHPHACLTCAQREGCTRDPCSTSVPVDERCCPKFGNCELQRVVEYVGIREDTPRYRPKNARVFDDEPLIHRDYNLCILCGRCVQACNDLRGIGVLGFIHRGHGAEVRTAFDDHLVDSDCMFCTTCVEVCPTGTLRDKDMGKGTREEVLVPCRSACPAGLDVPRFINHILNGRNEDACAVLWESLSIPNILGHICHHPCEDRCRRGKLNEPIMIRELQRYAASSLDREFLEKRGADTGKRVAVVGSGPAGLSAAYFLSGKGHNVTVFEADGEAGGMLRYAIPEYRLPREILDGEIDEIRNRGVEIRTGTRVESVKALKDEGYDAIFLAMGAPEEMPLEPQVGSLRNVLGALSYIRSMNIGNVIGLGDNVLIIGSGSAALEAARLARRTGSSNVDVLVSSGQEGSMHLEEFMMAQEEGVEFHYDTKVGAIEPTPEHTLKVGIKGPEGDREVTVNSVVNAQGSRPSVPGTFGVPVTVDGRIDVDEGYKVKGLEGVYSGGESVQPGIMAVEAVAQGRKGAEAIDTYLGGDGDVRPTFAPVERPDPVIGMRKGFFKLERAHPEVLPPEERLKGFKLECLTYGPEKAKEEAVRCLRCNLRLELSQVPRPPETILVLNEENVAKVPATEGVYTLKDADKNVLAIKGVEDLLAALKEKLQDPGNVAYFDFEEDKFFSKRENELLQQYMQVHGKMPEGAGGDDDLDDLF